MSPRLHVHSTSDIWQRPAVIRGTAMAKKEPGGRQGRWPGFRSLSESFSNCVRPRGSADLNPEQLFERHTTTFGTIPVGTLKRLQSMEGIFVYVPVIRLCGDWDQVPPSFLPHRHHITATPCFCSDAILPYVPSLSLSLSYSPTPTFRYIFTLGTKGHCAGFVRHQWPQIDGGCLYC